MKLLVIGNSVVDFINYKGVSTVKPGGIFYTIIALNNFKETNDKISLATAVDKEHYPLFSDEYEKIDEGLFSYVESVPKVWLKVEQFSERHERYENINQSLDPDIKNPDKYDGILINMITGFDITFEMLKTLRKSYQGLIYFDVHTMSRGLDKNYVRRFRKIPDFNEWASRLDFIQVNKNELKTLSEKENEEDIIDEVLGYGVKYIILTLESEGAKIFFRKDNKVRFIYEPAVKIDVKNKVGCGDVFGAVFFYSYIAQKNKNIGNALKLANTAAGFTASYGEMTGFKKLKSDVFAKHN